MRAKIPGIILVLAILALILHSPVASSSLTQTQTLTSSGQIIKGPSYIVWTKSGMYYANDTSGAIAYSSAIASNVLNYALATLTMGGSIFVTNGLYEIATKLDIINPNIVLEGESWNTTFKLSNAVNNALIVVTGANCSISNLQIDGNYIGQTGGYPIGILVYGAVNSIIENVYVHDTYMEGINIQNGASGTIVRNFRIDHTRLCGLVVYGKDASPTTRNIAISDGLVTNSGLAGQLANNLWFSGAQDSTASNLMLDTATDGNFEIQSEGITGGIARNITASNITCVNSAVGGIYLDGKDSSHRLTNVTLNNFNVYNSGIVGLSIFNYVEDSEIGNVVIDTTGNWGAHIDRNINNLNIHDITIKNTGGNGFHAEATVANSTFRKITVTGAQGANGGIVIANVNSANAPNSVLDSSVSNSKADDYYVYQAEGTIISGSTSTSSGGNGITLYDSDYVQLTNNTIRTPTGDGISMAYAYYPKVLGNSVFDLTSGKHGIQPSAVYQGLFSNNYIYSNTATNRMGFQFYLATNNTISNNYIGNVGTGIFLDSNVAGTFIFGNTINSTTTPISDSGVSTAIYDNTGYNPVGIITSPFSGNNHILLDVGGNNATWSSAVTYTNWESSKTLHINGGTITAVVQNGQQIFSTNGFAVDLKPGDTFSITFSSAPTIKVEGQ